MATNHSNAFSKIEAQPAPAYSFDETVSRLAALGIFPAPSTLFSAPTEPTEPPEGGGSLSPEEILATDPAYAEFCAAVEASAPDPLPEDLQPWVGPWLLQDPVTGEWREATPEEAAKIEAAMQEASDDDEQADWDAYLEERVGAYLLHC